MDILSTCVASWPLVCLVGFLVFVFTFKRPLYNFIERVTHVSATGASAVPSIAIPHQPEEKTANKAAAISTVNDQFDHPLVKLCSKSIRDDLQKLNQPIEGPSIDLLIKALALAQITAAHEETYNIIFGAQISFLKQCNLSKGIGRNAARKWYENVVLPNYNKFYETWDTDNFLKFLLARGLLESKDDVYLLTEAGTDFLGFIARKGYNEVKIP